MKGFLMENLILKQIPVSPNEDYMAGSDGKIYSRTRYKGFGRKVYVDWYALKGHQGKKKYSTVSLCHMNKKVTKSVHKLVCMAFHGMPKTISMQVRHLDGDPTNNKPENLAWGTQEENWQDRKDHGRGIELEKHPMSKLTNEERRHIRWAVEKGLASQNRIARILGMSQSAIANILNIQSV